MEIIVFFILFWMHFSKIAKYVRMRHRIQMNTNTPAMDDIGFEEHSFEFG